METNNSEPLMSIEKIEARSKLGFFIGFRMEFGGNLLTAKRPPV